MGPKFQGQFGLAALDEGLADQKTLDILLEVAEDVLNDSWLK